MIRSCPFLRLWTLPFFLLFFCSCHPSQLQTHSQICFRSHCLDVEVAKEPEALLRGLQFRKSLKRHTGMLFVFPKAGIRRFWMKDTWIPLDIIWLDGNHKVIFIESNTPPCRQDPCVTYGPLKLSRYVLEINAGEVTSLGIRIGDKAEFRY